MTDDDYIVIVAVSILKSINKNILNRSGRNGFTMV